MPKACRPPEELFWAKVQNSDGCWLWLANKDKDGYGRFQVSIPGMNKQRHVPAHRFSFELRHGRVPVGMLLHSCDTPACVRPDHLSEGTQLQNRSDCVARGREPRGEKKPNAILTYEVVRDARARVAVGTSVTALAKEYGVNYFTLAQAISGRTWRHVHG